MKTTSKTEIEEKGYEEFFYNESNLSTRDQMRKKKRQRRIMERYF